MISDAAPITDADVLTLARIFAFAATSHALSSHERGVVADIAGRFLTMGRACQLSTLDRELIADVSEIFGLEEAA
jgi:hypothetical protein